MTLTSRKVVVVSLIGIIFLAGNILVVANWLAEKGVEEKASWVRHEFLTGTAVNRLESRDFAVFETRTKTARTAQNPKTIEPPVEVPAKRTVKFKPGRLLRQGLELAFLIILLF